MKLTITNIEIGGDAIQILKRNQVGAAKKKVVAAVKKVKKKKCKKNRKKRKRAYVIQLIQKKQILQICVCIGKDTLFIRYFEIIKEFIIHAKV